MSGKEIESDLISDELENEDVKQSKVTDKIPKKLQSDKPVQPTDQNESSIMSMGSFDDN